MAQHRVRGARRVTLCMRHLPKKVLQTEARLAPKREEVGREPRVGIHMRVV
jgi:hypothetical protein